MSTCIDNDKNANAQLLLIGLLTIGSLLHSISSYKWQSIILSENSLQTINTFKESNEIKLAVPHGKVLTLAPIMSLEAGLTIYPEFAPGPFCWRVASSVAADRRPILSVVSTDELESFLKKDMPDAIITGYEDAIELPFIQFATKFNYKPNPLSNNIIVWLTNN